MIQQYREIEIKIQQKIINKNNKEEEIIYYYYLDSLEIFGGLFLIIIYLNFPLMMYLMILI